MVRGGSLLERAMSYVVDKLVVDSLANSHAFQRFAFRTNKGLENVSKGLGDVSQLAEQKKQEAAELLEYVTKTFHPVTWLSFLFLIVTGVGLVYYYDKEKKRHIEEINNASTTVKQGSSVGKAAIGDPFSLVNHEGKYVTDKDFRGKWTVMYFGFTHCPDICPDELQKLADAVNKIKENARIEIITVFISVDPERDTVEQVHDYVKGGFQKWNYSSELVSISASICSNRTVFRVLIAKFHPNLVGLTSSADEVRKVARA